MYDLMYCGEAEIYSEVKNTILSEYPDAEIEDASDGIHRYRFSVEIPDDVCDTDTWLRFTVKHKLAHISFVLEMMIQGDEAAAAKILKFIEEIHGENPTQTAN